MSLLGVKRTCVFAAHMSANDPKRTLRHPISNRYSCGKSAQRLIAELLDYCHQRFRADLCGAGKGMIDGDDRQKTAEDEKRQCSRHDALCPQIVGAEKKCEANGNECASEQHGPDDTGHDTVRYHQP